MRDRRAFLSALVAAPLAVPAVTSTASPAVDPIVTLFNERCALVAFINGPASTEEEGDVAFDRKCEIDHQVIGLRASSVSGARVSLEWALDELRTFYLKADDHSIGDKLLLALIEGAVSVLRAQGGVA